MDDDAGIDCGIEEITLVLQELTRNNKGMCQNPSKLQMTLATDSYSEGHL